MIGSPIANRKFPELSSLIGFFLSTVALRTSLDGKLSFQDFLARVDKTMTHALQNQDILFDDLVRTLNPNRAPGQHPLFSSMFIFQGEREARPLIDIPGHTFEMTYLLPEVSKVDLSFFATERNQSLELLFEYRSDKFSPEIIEGWLHNLKNLLEDLTVHPKRSLSHLNLLSNAEQKKLLPPLPLYSNAPNILESISHAVQNSPDKAAIDGSVTLTYRELWEQSTLLAAELHRQGFRHQVIALLIPREAAAIVAILGILRSGNCYLPLDPDSPPKRLSTLLELSSADAILSQGKLANRFPNSLPTLDLSQTFKPGPLPEQPKEDDVAYLIFTSGSTGTPKPVSISHRNLAISTSARATYYSKPPERFLLLSALIFDSSVAGIFWTLTTGGTLYPLPIQIQQDPTALTHFIKEHRISHTLGLPSLAQVLLEDSEEEDLSSLQTLIVAGEPCPAELARLHHHKIPDGELFNEYGPTEATVWATAHKVSPHDNPVPIGHPISCLRAFPVDPEGQLVPVGMIGELAISGPTLSFGYLGRPELTNQKFTSIKLNNETTRIYRTGDLVRTTPSGELIYLGRSDNQIKIRGFRIELGEIESLLISHPQVRQALVAADTQLHAFIVSSEPLSAEDLHFFLAKKLPDYMIPATISFVESLPTLANGKADRTALSRLIPEPSNKKEHIPPRNEVESALAQIWQTCLNGEPPSIHDHFFQSGGDSLLALRFISQARKANFKLAMGDLSHYPSIASLASNLKQKRKHLIHLSNKESSAEKLYCFPLFDGRLDLFHDFVEHTPDLSLIGLQPPGIGGSTPPCSRMSELANFYSDLIQQHSQGPYQLIGFCSAAPMVYQTACRLREQGKQITSIILVDATAPRKNLIAPKKFRKLLTLRRQFQANGSTLGAIFTVLAESTSFRLKKLLPSYFPQEERDSVTQAIADASLEAIDEFQLSKADFPILFVQTWAYQAWDDVFLQTSMKDFWRRSASDFSIHYLACKHDHCFKGLAGKELARLIAEAPTA